MKTFHSSIVRLFLCLLAAGAIAQPSLAQEDTTSESTAPNTARERKEWSKSDLRELAASKKPLSGFRIGIDAGMGAEAPLQGKTNLKKVDGYMRMAEAMQNLKVARVLSEQLDALGAECVELFGSTPAAPEERLAQARGKGLDFIVSVHHSYSVTRTDNLTAAYYTPGDDSASESLARRVNESLSVGLGLPATGAVAAPNLLTNLQDTPVAVVICSLLSNADEFLHAVNPDEDYAEREGKVIAQGILTSLKERAGILEKDERPSKMIQAPVWRSEKLQLAMSKRPVPSASEEPVRLIGIPAAEPARKFDGAQATSIPAAISPAAEEPKAPAKPAAVQTPAIKPIATVEKVSSMEIVAEEDWSDAFEALEKAKTPGQVSQAMNLQAPAEPSQVKPKPTATPTPTITPTPKPIPTITPSPSPSPTPKPQPSPTPSPTALPLDIDDLPAPKPLDEIEDGDAPAVDDVVDEEDAPMASADVPTTLPFKAVFHRPVKAPIDQTWLFGEVYDQAKGTRRGVSFQAPAGTPVLAIAAGKVVEAVYDEAVSPTLPFPRSILIEHSEKIDGQTVYSMYGQLAEIKVANGDKVKVGQAIGTTGAPYDITVNDRSTEFEFEIRVGGKSLADARNPELFLQPLSSDTGLIVGQFASMSGQALTGKKIEGIRKDSEYYSYTLTYDSAAKPTHWQENFAVSDVPAGEYTLDFGDGLTRKVKVEPGKASYLRVVK